LVQLVGLSHSIQLPGHGWHAPLSI